MFGLGAGDDRFYGGDGDTTVYGADGNDSISTLQGDDLIFGGNGETLTLSHETLSPTSYVRGITIALAAVEATEGVIVGLDKLVDLSAAPAPVPTAAAAGAE